MLCLLTYRMLLILTEFDTESNDIWPLHDGQMSIIDRNKSKLMDLLDTEYDLLPALRATTCLSRHQIDSLQAIPNVHERNLKLLEMLKRRSISQFNKFIECLERYQRHLIPFLTGDEGNQVSVSISSSHVAQIDELIRSQQIYSVIWKVQIQMKLSDSMKLKLKLDYLHHQ